MNASVEELKRKAVDAVDSLSGRLRKISEDIHKNPELAFKEYKAANWLASFLEEEGFKVQRNAAGMETAFIAEYISGEGGPTISILAEYDALPGVGHACGHNIIGTSAAGAGVALKRALTGTGLPGRVLVLGTPAEEGGGGKVLMVKADVFKEVDASLMVHPTSGLSRIGGRSLATHSFQFDYYGKPAHAAGSPTEGINALDAVNIFFHAVACLRQHVPDDVRMHGMVTMGGDAVNIIPEHTQVRYLARSYSLKTLARVVESVKKCAEAGAVATGCRLEVQEQAGYLARIPNMAISEVFLRNLNALGEETLPGVVDGKGSTDFGDVSREVPACNAYIRIAPEGVAGHSREFCQASVSDAGTKALYLSAKSMAHTAIDLLTDPALLSRAKAEFLKGRDS